MKPREAREYAIYQAFEVSVVLKGLNALVEIALGALLLFVDARALLEALVRNELLDDPTDFLATHLHSLALHLSPQATLYGALYLLSHGLVKIVLVWGLLRDKLWAYPASLAVLGLFVLYQVFKIVETHSVPLVALTVFDLVVMWLIFHEYRVRGKRP